MKTLSVSNASIKGHRLSVLQKIIIIKQYPTVCCLQVTHFRLKHSESEKVGENNIFYANSNQKKRRDGYANIRQNRL